MVHSAVVHTVEGSVWWVPTLTLTHQSTHHLLHTHLQRHDKDACLLGKPYMFCGKDDYVSLGSHPRFWEDPHVFKKKFKCSFKKHHSVAVTKQLYIFVPTVVAGPANHLSDLQTRAFCTLLSKVVNNSEELKGFLR